MRRSKLSLIVLLALSLTICMSTNLLAESLAPVNINTATLEELTTLTRIGPQYAQRIIDFRNTEGPFATPEEIMQVKGIGLKTWEANKDRIVVE
ncbi:MAG: helix-hairpin-helix domain-containing protein [Desulfobacteraceae bacterium]|nr:helix-hairpin-helix domain-containing protein [Desulfobacteraceae bacterium]